MKDKLENGQQSNVVYAIPCIQCSKTYIGETSRCLCERCEQHKKDVENKVKNPNKTALVRHVSKMDHQFDFGNTKILRKVRTRGLLKIHVANNIILNENNVVNFKKDAKHISPVVYNLIKKKLIGKNMDKRNGQNMTTLHETLTDSEQSHETAEHLIRQQ